MMQRLLAAFRPNRAVDKSLALGLVLFWAGRAPISWRGDYLLDALLPGIGGGEGLLGIYALRMTGTGQAVSLTVSDRVL